MAKPDFAPELSVRFFRLLVKCALLQTEMELCLYRDRMEHGGIHGDKTEAVHFLGE